MARILLCNWQYWAVSWVATSLFRHVVTVSRYAPRRLCRNRAYKPLRIFRDCSLPKENLARGSLFLVRRYLGYLSETRRVLCATAVIAISIPANPALCASGRPTSLTERSRKSASKLIERAVTHTITRYVQIVSAVEDVKGIGKARTEYPREAKGGAGGGGHMKDLSGSLARDGVIWKS